MIHDLAKAYDRDYYLLTMDGDSIILSPSTYNRSGEYPISNTTTHPDISFFLTPYLEEPMTYKQCIAGCAMLMLSLSTSAAIATATTGGSTKVQLQVEHEWQLPDKPIDVVYSLNGQKVFILTDQNQVLVYKTEGDIIGVINVDEGVTSIDIAPLGEKLYLLNSKDNSFTSVSVNFVVSIDTKGSPYLGNINAPVTLTYFTDFE